MHRDRLQPSAYHGLSLLRRLRERGEVCPAAIITSNPSRAVRQQRTDSGAVLIQKPLLTDCLTGAVRHLVSNPAPVS